MNCRDWEERIALWAGGDLSAAEAGGVERHVAGCEDCRRFAEGVRQSLGVLREAHEEPIAPAHFAAVRARVIGELEGARAPWWRRSWVYGFCAAAAVTVLLMAPLRPGPAPPPPRVALVRPPAPVVEKAISPPHAAKLRRPLRASRKPVPSKSEPLVVKLLTDDPDVVIYWIADQGEN
jgi:hypothetical protein